MMQVIRCEHKACPFVAVTKGVALGDASEEHGSFIEGIRMRIHSFIGLKSRSHHLLD